MKTIIDLLENSAQKYPDNPYLLEKKTDRYESVTYRETREQTYKVAAGLLSLGIKKGEKIASYPVRCCQAVRFLHY
jgi:long-chain acyl-CoA synthetase